MKNSFTYLIIIFYSYVLNAQTSAFIKSFNQYDGLGVFRINNINIITYRPATSYTNFIAELTDDGDTLKTKKLNIQNKVSGFGFKKGYGQNEILAYTTTTYYSSQVYGSVFAKTDSSLNFSIVKRYTRATPNAFVVEPNEQNDFSFIFAGRSAQNQNFDDGISDIAIMKTNKFGTPLWAKIYDNNGNTDAGSPNIIIDSDKNMYVYGTTGDISFSLSNFFLLKTDSLGYPLWAKRYGGSNDNGARDLFEINNNFFVIGNTNSFGATNYGIFLMKIDANGDLIDAKVIYNNQGSPTFNVKYTGNGIFTLTCIANYSNSWDFVAIQIDTNGIVINNKAYSLSAGSNYGNNFVRANDGGYIFNCTGNTGPPNYKEYPILFKTDSLFNNSCLPSYSLNFTTTDVTSQTHDTAITFNVTNITVNVSADTIYPSTDVYSVNTDCFGYLGMEEEKINNEALKIYPNPSNGNFTLQINQSKAAERACLVIYDVLGKEVYTMQNIVLTAGLNEIKLATQQLPPGIYFCKLNIDDSFYGGKISIR